jgi:hypothetical protein
MKNRSRRAIGGAIVLLALAGLACYPPFGRSAPEGPTPTLGGLVGRLTATAEASQGATEVPMATALPTKTPDNAGATAPAPTDTETDEPTGTPDATATQSPEPTRPPSSGEEPTATRKPSGLTPGDPAPPGSRVTIGDLTMWVGIVRRPADQMIEEANWLNADPGAGNEYVMIMTHVTCNKNADEVCTISAEFELSVVGSSDVTHSPEWLISGIDGMFESGNVSGGDTRSGWLIFEVGQGETNLILAYQQFFGSGRAYLAVR